MKSAKNLLPRTFIVLKIFNFKDLVAEANYVLCYYFYKEFLILNNRENTFSYYVLTNNFEVRYD